MIAQVPGGPKRWSWGGLVMGREVGMGDGATYRYAGQDEQTEHQANKTEDLRRHETEAVEGKHEHEHERNGLPAEPVGRELARVHGAGEVDLGAVWESVHCGGGEAERAAGGRGGTGGLDRERENMRKAA